MVKTKAKPKPKAEKPKRQKYVYPTDRIAHLWAHQTQDEARNPQGNLYFQGATIFSYGRHFPIARFVTHKDKRCIFFTTCTCSVTTARHVSHVRQAIPRSGSFTVFDVDDVNATPLQALMAYKKKCREAAATVLKSKNYISRANAFAELEKCGEKIMELVDFFGFKMRVSPTDYLTPAAFERCVEDQRRAEEARRIRQQRAREQAEKQRAEWEAKYEAERPAREAAEKLRQEEEAKHDAEIAADWIAGVATRNHWRLRSMPTMLRIEGENVVTSMGAEFPLKHAIRLLPRLKGILERGETFAKNGRELRLGVYSLDRIDAEGTVFCGCHEVAKAEVLRFIGVLEALPPTTLFEYADATDPELSHHAQERSDAYRDENEAGSDQRTLGESRTAESAARAPHEA